MKTLSVRHRLMFAYAMTVAVIILLFGLLLGWGMNRSFNDRLHASLESVAYDIKHDVESVPHLPPLLDPKEEFEVAPVYIEVYRSQKGADERVLYSKNMQDRHLPKISKVKFAIMDIPFISTSDESALYSIATQAEGYQYRISVATPIDMIDDFLEEFMQLFALFGIFVYLLALYLGYRLINSVLSPMEQITTTAASITHSNLSRRISLPLIEDEFFILTKTFNAMLDRIENAFDKIRQFNANVSHELKTPLTIIQGEAEVALLKKRDHNTYEKVLRSIIDESHEMHQIIDSMLLLSKSDISSLKARMIPVDLEALVMDVIKDKRSMAEDKDIKINIIKIRAMQCVGEPTLLREAIANVLDNAIKYSSDEKTIEIALTRDGNGIDLSIKDAGIGMGETSLSKTFDPFWREDTAHSKRVSGHGLGLSIVKWIMDAHEGTVIMQSEKGKGTRCILHLD